MLTMKWMWAVMREFDCAMIMFTACNIRDLCIPTCWVFLGEPVASPGGGVE